MDNQAGKPLDLWLSDTDKAALRDFWSVYDTHYEELTRRVMETIQQNPRLKKLVPLDRLNEQRLGSRERMRTAMYEGQWAVYLKNLQLEGSAYAQSGLDFQDWYEMLSVYRGVALALLFEKGGWDSAHLLEVTAAYDRFSDQAMALIGEAYLSAKEEIIHRQQEVIQELSTPVLVVRDKLLLLPIIGLIDSYRAQQITEHLLQSIRATRAQVAVLDITGVLTVDSMVANHLIKTAEAAHLMGARTIITGISTEIAQTLVRIGVNLRHLSTVGDLRTGIEEADRILGYRLITVSAEAPTLTLEKGKPS